MRVSAIKFLFEILLDILIVEVYLRAIQVIYVHRDSLRIGIHHCVAGLVYVNKAVWDAFENAFDFVVMGLLSHQIEKLHL